MLLYRSKGKHGNKGKMMTVVTEKEYLDYLKVHGTSMKADKTSGYPMTILQWKNEAGLVMAQKIQWHGKTPIHHIRKTSRV
jgi:hypothetical protein